MSTFALNRRKHISKYLFVLVLFYKFPLPSTFPLPLLPYRYFGLSGKRGNLLCSASNRRQRINFLTTHVQALAFPGPEATAGYAEQFPPKFFVPRNFCFKP